MRTPLAALAAMLAISAAVEHPRPDRVLECGRRTR
jgi:hypothetical protein